MAWRGIAARMEGRANLCGEVRAITVEAGEDVGAIRFGLMAISSWRCQLDFPGSRLSSVGQRPRETKLRMLSLAAAIAALVGYYSIQFYRFAVEPARAYTTRTR